MTSHYLDIKPALPSASYCISLPYVANAEGERREIASIYQCHYRQAARKIDVGVGASQSIHDVAVTGETIFPPAGEVVSLQSHGQAVSLHSHCPVNVQRVFVSPNVLLMKTFASLWAELY